MPLNWIDPQIPNIRIAKLVSEPSYSHDVHYGETREDGSQSPARPFIDAAIAQTDFEESVAEEFKISCDIADAFDATAILLHGNIREQIESPIWKWDKVTIRSDGSKVSTPRDIVDTGYLRDNQKLYLDGEQVT